MKINNFFTACLLLIAALALTTSSCKKDDDKDECVTENMSFKDDITPILTDNGCTASACHSPANAATLFDYTVHANFKFASVDANRVLGAIKHQDMFSPMPKGGEKLSDCEISKIEAWIDQGALDN